jgi:hypothetical protein
MMFYSRRLIGFISFTVLFAWWWDPFHLRRRPVAITFIVVVRDCCDWSMWGSYYLRWMDG